MKICSRMPFGLLLKVATLVVLHGTNNPNHVVAAKVVLRGSLSQENHLNELREEQERRHLEEVADVTTETPSSTPTVEGTGSGTTSGTTSGTSSGTTSGTEEGTDEVTEEGTGEVPNEDPPNDNPPNVDEDPPNVDEDPPNVGITSDPTSAPTAKNGENAPTVEEVLTFLPTTPEGQTTGPPTPAPTVEGQTAGPTTPEPTVEDEETTVPSPNVNDVGIPDNGMPTLPNTVVTTISPTVTQATIDEVIIIRPPPPEQLRNPLLNRPVYATNNGPSQLKYLRTNIIRPSLSIPVDRQRTIPTETINRLPPYLISQTGGFARLGDPGD